MHHAVSVHHVIVMVYQSHCIVLTQMTKTFKLLHADDAAATALRKLERKDFIDFILDRELMDKPACEAWSANAQATAEKGVYSASDEYATVLYSHPSMTLAIEFHKVSSRLQPLCVSQC